MDLEVCRENKKEKKSRTDVAPIRHKESHLIAVRVARYLIGHERRMDERAAASFSKIKVKFNSGGTWGGGEGYDGRAREERHFSVIYTLDVIVSLRGRRRADFSSFPLADPAVLRRHSSFDSEDGLQKQFGTPQKSAVDKNT